MGKQDNLRAVLPQLRKKEKVRRLKRCGDPFWKQVPDAPAARFHRCGFSAWNNYFINTIRYICGAFQKKGIPRSLKKKSQMNADERRYLITNLRSSASRLPFGSGNPRNACGHTCLHPSEARLGICGLFLKNLPLYFSSSP
jgi:hypothetical protein